MAVRKTKSLSSLTAKKAREFNLQTGFTMGYRNREDITLLPSGVMVTGSQNVLTSVRSSILSRKGYTLDGEVENTDVYAIMGSFDWTKLTNNDTHVRSWNDRIEFRYVNPVTDVPVWLPLITGLTSPNFNFCTFWNTTELTTVMLGVNGTSNIYEWSGGVATYASATTNTITKTGTDTWAQSGFYTSGTRSITMIDTGGTARTFAYTGGESTTTLTGVTPDPTAYTFTANETAAFQSVRTTANSSTTGLPSAFKNDVIGNLLNQIYIGSNTSNYLYISRLSDYTNYTQVDSAQPRAPGDGAIKTLGGYVTALIVQDQDMYIGAGKDLIYKTTYVQSTNSVVVGGVEVSTVYEQINIDQVKTADMQGIQSQAVTTKIKNNIAYLSFEPIVNTLGSVNGIFQNLQVSDISYPIVNDMNSYDFTDASLFYHRQFLYVAVPAEGLTLIYNMTNSGTDASGRPMHYWEAPQTLPFSRFSVIDNDLYGHGYGTPNTYKLFDGYNDNGQQIQSVVKFSFQNYGSRSATKSFNEYYVEGYISGNTTLTLGLQYDIDGCATSTSYNLVGTDTQFVCIPSNDASLGKVSLGKNPLGSSLTDVTDTPKFRIIQTFPRTPFYEFQASFSSLGTDQQWEILSFGGAVSPTAEGNNAITR